MSKKVRAETTFSLKDQLFNPKKVRYLSELLYSAWSRFPSKQFEAATLRNFSSLELKERISRITDILETTLPPQFPEALEIILKALPPPCDPTLSDNDFGDFIFEPLNQYVSRRGLVKQHLNKSLDALSILTQRFSAEYAIRPFLRTFEKETLKVVRSWTNHSHYHVRRLASEGIRPNLPWGEKILIEPKKIIEILDCLHHDSTRFVTRSVANNLNDISKYDPTLVCSTLSHWTNLGKQREEELTYMTKHALRTLTSRGDTAALALQGITILRTPRVQLRRMPKRVRLGETALFEFQLHPRESGSFLVDFVVVYPRDRGGTKERVFKGKVHTLTKNRPVVVCKKIAFKPMTTRVLTEGEHAIQVQINGKRGESFPFSLVLAVK